MTRGVSARGWLVRARFACLDIRCTYDQSKEDGVAEQPTETPILDLIELMTMRSLDASGLDPKSLMLVRLAALIATDAPPVSYMLNLNVASELGIDAQDARDVLAAVAPIVGTVKVASAMTNIVKGLGLAIDLIELEELSKS